MSKQELAHTAAMEAVKGTPPVIVATTAKAQSWTGADIVTALTIVYLVLQILWLLWKWWKSVKSGAVQG